MQATLDRLMRAAAGKVFTAATLVVLRRGKVVFSGAYGDATLSTVFDLASVTKLFTTTAFLSLVSEGRVTVDTPLVDVLPAFGVTGPRPIDGGVDPHSKQSHPTPPSALGKTVDPSGVTLRHLLTHTSGLAPWRAVYAAAGEAPPPPTEPDPLSREERWARGLAFMCGSAFVGEVGSGLRYSDIGLMLLGESVARVGVVRLDDAISARITRRLSLNSMTFRPLDAGVPCDRIAPTEDDPGWRGRRAWGEVHDENACGVGGVAGHAGLFGAALDLARFGEAWRTSDARLGLNDDVRQAALTEQATDGEGMTYGLGWRLQPDGSYGHTGFTGTSLRVDPRREAVTALLTNRVFFGRERDGITDLRVAVRDTIGRGLDHVMDGR